MLSFWIFSISILKYLGVIVGILLFFLEFNFRYNQAKILFRITLIVFLGLVLEMYYTLSIYGINAFPLLLANIGIVLFLLKGNVNPTPINLILIALFIYCGYFMFTGNSARLVLGDLTFSTGRSTNHISVILIFITCVYYIVNRINGKTINLVSALFTFIISSWAIGRSGIIASSALLFGTFFFTKRTKLDYILIGTASIFFVLFFWFSYSIDLPFVLSYDKFYENELLMDIRFDLNRSYLAEMDLKSFFLGMDWEIMNTNKLFFQIKNLHNSYTNAHFRLGIFSIVIFSLALYILIKFFFHRELYFVLLLVILLRAFSDTILLPAYPFDFVFYYLLTVGFSSDGKYKQYRSILNQQLINPGVHTIKSKVKILI